MALPVRLGGVGIVNPVSNSQHMFEASVRLTSPLIAAIATQDQDQLIDTYEVMEIKSSIRKPSRDHQKHLAESVYDRLSPQLKRFVDLAREKGTSSWLSVLPLVFPSTKASLEMHFASDMVGNCRTPQQNATVA